MPLLERTGRRVTLTPAGTVLAGYAESVFAVLEEASAALAATRDRLAGPLRIGAFPSAARVILPPALVALGRDHPGLELMVTELDPVDVPDALRSGALDVALTFVYDYVPAAPDPALDSEPLLEEIVYLATAARRRTRAGQHRRAGQHCGADQHRGLARRPVDRGQPRHPVPQPGPPRLRGRRLHAAYPPLRRRLRHRARARRGGPGRLPHPAARPHQSPVRCRAHSLDVSPPQQHHLQKGNPSSSFHRGVRRSDPQVGPGSGRLAGCRRRSRAGARQRANLKLAVFAGPRRAGRVQG